MATKNSLAGKLASTHKQLKTLIMEQSNPQHKEGKIAMAIEEQTAKLPSDIFLWAALGSMAVSFAMQLSGSKHRSLFIGQWAAPFLLLGVYNKLVKLEGHDKSSPENPNK